MGSVPCISPGPSGVTHSFVCNMVDCCSGVSRWTSGCVILVSSREFHSSRGCIVFPTLVFSSVSPSGSLLLLVLGLDGGNCSTCRLLFALYFFPLFFGQTSCGSVLL